MGTPLVELPKGIRDRIESSRIKSEKPDSGGSGPKRPKATARSRVVLVLIGIGFLDKAPELARAMVTRYGRSDASGVATYEAAASPYISTPGFGGIFGTKYYCETTATSEDLRVLWERYGEEPIPSVLSQVNVHGSPEKGNNWVAPVLLAAVTLNCNERIKP